MTCVSLVLLCSKRATDPPSPSSRVSWPVRRRTLIRSQHGWLRKRIALACFFKLAGTFSPACLIIRLDATPLLCPCELTQCSVQHPDSLAFPGLGTVDGPNPGLVVVVQAQMLDLVVWQVDSVPLFVRRWSPELSELLRTVGTWVRCRTAGASMVTNQVAEQAQRLAWDTNCSVYWFYVWNDNSPTLCSARIALHYCSLHMHAAGHGLGPWQSLNQSYLTESSVQLCSTSSVVYVLGNRQRRRRNRR